MIDATRPARLEDLLRREMRARDYRRATERQQAFWYRSIVLHRGKRHPRDLGSEGAGRFLTHLALERDIAPATHHQAVCGLQFLYRNVLGIGLGDTSDFAKACRKPRLPVVLSREKG